MVSRTNREDPTPSRRAPDPSEGADSDGSMAGELLDDEEAFPDDGEARNMMAAAAAAFAEPEATDGLPGHAPARAASSYRLRQDQPKSRFSGLKATAVPILLTVGVLLLVPGIWALMLLSGRSVWQSDRDDAAAMAKVMIACLPIGLVLISSSVVFFVQLRAETPQRGGSV